VKFLESAGARVVPVSFLLPEDELRALLDKLNGLYIPGDNQAVVGNADFAQAVHVAYKFAHDENSRYESFPVVFTQWSFVTYMREISKRIES
jgi:hypothetical protein